MRRSVVSGVLAGAGVVVWASAGWACTPAASISVERPAGVVAPRQELTVHGSSFTDRLPVEVRWDAAEGPLLATSKGPSFNIALHVPAEATGGPHTIVALQHDASGAVVGKSADVVQLAGGGPAVPAWTGAVPAGSQGTAGSSAPLFLVAGAGAAGVVGMGLVVAARRRRLAFDPVG